MDNKNPNLAIVEITKAFQTIADAREVSQDDLLIWGGHFAPEQLSDFVQAWDGSPHFLWAMVEEVSTFYVKKANTPGGAIPQPEYLLLRLRIFGPDGDLDIRRDGNRFYWHFIGDANAQWQILDDEAFALSSFWADAPDPPAVLREVEKRYYQWKRDMLEQRVKLDWVPQNEPNKTFNYLKQRHYLDNGRIAFVRYVDFKEDVA